MFSFYATKLGRRGEWFSLLSGLSACSGIALISMAIAMNMSSLGELAPKKR